MASFYLRNNNAIQINMSLIKRKNQIIITKVKSNVMDRDLVDSRGKIVMLELFNIPITLIMTLAIFRIR